jgi:hypothetical protein
LSNENNNNEDNKDNIEDIKIIQIRKNEHFGDALMFLNERCPLIAKVRTKTAELLILRKLEAIEIYSIYPNIWKRINKKSLFNMEQIYIKIRKMVITLSKRYNLKIENKTSIGINKKAQRFTKFILNNINEKSNNKIYEESTKSENLPKTEDITKTKDENNYSQSEIIKQKVKDLDEQTINSSFNQGMNMVKNMTFSKKTSEKESTSSLLKFTLKNESQNIHLIDSNTLTNNTNEELVKKNRIISGFKNSNKNLIKLIKTPHSDLSLFKFINKTKEKDNSNKAIRDNFLTNIQSNFLTKDNLSSESPSNSNKKTNIKRTLTDKEELLNNAFNNLTMIREKNFKINSSYENINAISHYKYIKDNNLQSKTKKFIINQSSNSTKIKGDSFLKLPGVTKELQLSNIKDETKSDISSVLSEVFDFDNKNSSFSLDRTNYEKKSNRKEKSKKQNSLSNKSDSIKSKRNEKKISTNKIIDLRKLKRFPSSQNIMNSLNFNSLFIEDSKIKRKFFKKESSNLTKKLNIISNNIKNTSKIINNPEEFYADFFNNILIKESSARYEKKKLNHIRNEFSA